MKIAIRANGSKEIGFGHLARCLSLAEELQIQGASIVLLTNHRSQFLNERLNNSGFKSYYLSDYMHEAELIDASNMEMHDAELTQKILTDIKPDSLILDSYDLGISWEKIIRPNVKDLMVIDDLASRPHYCSILLDQNIIENYECRYFGLVPTDCNLLLGPNYSLLSKNYKSIRSRKINGLWESIQEKNILVFFTGSAEGGKATLMALKGIEKFCMSERVTVVLGASSVNEAEIRSLCTSRGWTVYVETQNMHELLLNAKFAVGGAGVSCLERCCVGVPSIVVSLSEVQVSICRELEKIGAAMYLGSAEILTPDDYVKALKFMYQTDLKNMSINALKICDGTGAERVAKFLMHQIGVNS